MKAILINPKEKTVKDIDFNDTLENMYKTIGCECISTVGLVSLGGKNNDEITLYVDDEGLFKNPISLFSIKGGYQNLAGNGLVVGHDGKGGSCDCPFTAKDIADEVEWVKQ